MSRIALGCMRLSTDEPRDEARALSTITAALSAGISSFDTAHSYGRGEDDVGHNEALLAHALSARPDAHITTKCGMSRAGGRWEPDGRAASVLADARASKSTLVRPPDLLLLHARDRRVPLATSVRALVRAKEEGVARAIGLSNVTRGQLEALAGVEIAAVQVALGAFDDVAARGGVVSWCRERGIVVQAHSPLGGPARARRLSDDPLLRAIASRHDVTPGTLVLAYLLALAENIVPVVGARTAETARAAATAERVVLDERDLEQLDARFPGLAIVRRPPRCAAPRASGAEVVLVMGIAGSGKSRLAARYVERGFERLNRDTQGGTLAGIARRLDARLAAGAKRLVLDNTYVTRASRSEVVRVTAGHGASVRCVHVATPAPEARVNAVLRMLERYGALLGEAEVRALARTDAGLFMPDVIGRMERQLEVPAEDEGFSAIERVSFVREHAEGQAGAAFPIELVEREAPEVHSAIATLAPSAPVLVFGWRPGRAEESRRRLESLARSLFAERPADIALCEHADGPPQCWCRPPLPGLWLAFARRHRVDARRSVLVAASKAHEAMAQTVGLRVVEVPPRR